jgi:hypothetical protein
VLPEGPLLPLTPPLPGMPAIVESFSDDFRSLYQNDFRLFTVKTFAHFSDTSTKAKITPAVSPERYITSIALFLIRFLCRRLLLLKLPPVPFLLSMGFGEKDTTGSARYCTVGELD